MANFEYAYIKNIDVNDCFFDSLRDDYNGFNDWFNKKGDDNEKAFYSKKEKSINGFLYLKKETIDDKENEQFSRPLKHGDWIKIGTFKIDAHGTKMGESFIKKSIDYAIENNILCLYTTIFPKYSSLIKLLQKYGFIKHGEKISDNGKEVVLVKNISNLQGNLFKNYPLINASSKKYLLAIDSDYHTKLFPDSILNNESYNIIEDVSHTNSIHKIFLSNAFEVERLKSGDILVMYRMKPEEDKSPAKYKSVATSICTVEAIKCIKNFKYECEFIEYCEPYSVFSKESLEEFWRNKKYTYIIKMIYNAALKKRITREILIDEIGIHKERWTFFQLGDTEFMEIIKRGKINESIIVH